MERIDMGDENEEKEIQSCPGLYSAIKQDPRVLQKMEKVQFVQTPLHEAAARGDTTVAMEMMNFMPSLGRKLNLEGLSPLHVAIEAGRVGTGEALVRFDKNLVRVKGKGGLTPLHYACAIHPDHKEQALRLLADFLVDCPDSINDLNNRFQSAVHVALEARNWDAFEMLVNWITKSARQSVLGWRDDTGNIAIHYAILYAGLQQVKTLVKFQKVNKMNSELKTPLDIAEDYNITGITERVEKIKELKYRGGRRSADIATEQTPFEYFKCGVSAIERLNLIYYLNTMDLGMEMRNVILVVATLICTATYQGVLQPPGGLYQASADTNAKLVSAGVMVMRDAPNNSFMPTNTLAFMLSTIIIMFAVPSRPFRPLIILLLTSLAFMCLCYLGAYILISGNNRTCRIIGNVASAFVVLAFISKILYLPAIAIFHNIWWAGATVRVALVNFPHCRPLNNLTLLVARIEMMDKLLDTNPDIHA